MTSRCVCCTRSGPTIGYAAHGAAALTARAAENAVRCNAFTAVEAADRPIRSRWRSQERPGHLVDPRFGGCCWCALALSACTASDQAGGICRSGLALSAQCPVAIVRPTGSPSDTDTMDRRRAAGRPISVFLLGAVMARSA